MSAPTNNQVRLDGRLQQLRVAKDMKNGISDVLGGPEIEASAINDLVTRKHNVPQYGKHLLTNATNHLTIYKCTLGWVLQSQCHAMITLQNAQIKIGMLFKHLNSAIGFAAPVQDCQCTTSQQTVQSAGTRLPTP